MKEIILQEGNLIRILPLAAGHLQDFYELVRCEDITKFMKFDTAHTLEDAEILLKEYLEHISFLLQDTNYAWL